MGQPGLAPGERQEERGAARREDVHGSNSEAFSADRAEEEREGERRAAEEEAARAEFARAESDRIARRNQAQRVAHENDAQRAAERGDAVRAAQAAAERAAAERAGARRAAEQRVASERAAEQAGAQAAAERAAAERAQAEQAAAERVAALAAKARAAAEEAAKRAEAEAEAASQAERAAAERMAAATVDAIARRRPVMTVDAEEEEDDMEEDDEEPDRAPRPTVTTQELILAGRSDSLQAALASIALRIDALTSTTSTFRNLVSDRITDYAEQVGRLAAGAAGDLDDYRHLHERALEQIRRSVGEAEDNIRRLSRSVGDLDSKVGALVAAVRDSGDAVDQMTAERDQVSDTLLRGVERVENALLELTEGKGSGSIARLKDMITALAGERERQEAAGAQLDAAVVALADDREHGADVLVRLERAVTELTTGRDRVLAKALARLEARFEELSTAVSGLPGDDLAATVSRLDARLKEMSTELVVGRDRETARAVAQLSAQVDGIASLVAEGRTDLSPIEARLNRLARAVPQPVPIDLGELYARLDELAGVVAQNGAPDLSELEAHLDQLARRAEPDPTWTTAVERLERLLPALEGMRAPGPARGETPAAAQDRRDLVERFDQLGQQLGEQLEALRRRIALRARPAGQGLDDDTIAAIADAVVARLNEAAPRQQSTLPVGSPPPVRRPRGPVEENVPPKRPPRDRSAPRE